MHYYRCSTEQLQLEAQRRGYATSGTRDQLGEALKKDDNDRGTDASTVKTQSLGNFAPRELNLSRTAEFGETTPAMMLVNESMCASKALMPNTHVPAGIVYWTMNTFFPTLQLFFQSGRSCTIDGGRLPNAVVGLDPQLRFRLTDCTHEEDGRLVKSMLSAKYASSLPGILIKEVAVAQRTSMIMGAMKLEGDSPKTPFPSMTFSQETHTVVGFRLEGIRDMAYVWAKADAPSGPDKRRWGDVRIGSLRDDVPSPLLFIPVHAIQPSCVATLVDKGSQIRARGRPPMRRRRKPIKLET
jgi:hypothetical protein